MSNNLESANWTQTINTVIILSIIGVILWVVL